MLSHPLAVNAFACFRRFGHHDVHGYSLCALYPMFSLLASQIYNLLLKYFNTFLVFFFVLEMWGTHSNLLSQVKKVKRKPDVCDTYNATVIEGNKERIGIPSWAAKAAQDHCSMTLVPCESACL